MGLDMYLEGRKHLHNMSKMRDEKGFSIMLPPTMEGGFELKEKVLRLATWRKHPNLHGYIVENYANDGHDECNPIRLDKEKLEAIIEAIKNNELPVTEGFFFGKSYGFDDKRQQDAKDIALFEAAIKWEETDEDGVWREIEYVASW